MITSSVIFGAVYSSENGEDPALLMEKYLDFLLEETTRAADETAIAESFVLYPNYPNPFNPVTRIRFSVNGPCHVTVRVFDSRGRLVQTLFQGFKYTGTYELTFMPRNAASGVYTAVVQAGEKRRVQKMVLQK
jgi:hypothetical protein